jgi:hypothetical protein
LTDGRRGSSTLLHEHGLDCGAQFLGKIGDCANTPVLAWLATRLAPSHDGVGRWGRRRWIHDAADLGDLLRRERWRRTTARAMHGSAPGCPVRAVFGVPKTELFLDRLHPLAVIRPGLALALACLVTKDRLTAALTRNAPDKFLPVEAIIVSPEDIRKRWNARRLDDLGPPHHRCQSVPSVLLTGSAAKGRNDRLGHSDLIGFVRIERLLFSPLGLISIGVLSAKALAVAATPELDASKPGRSFGDESSMAVGQDLGHHFRGSFL